MSEIDPVFNPDDAKSWPPPSSETVSIPVINYNRGASIISELAHTLEEDEFGVKRLQGGQVEALRDALFLAGVTVNPPEENEIRQGTERARALVANGQARDELDSQDIMPSAQFFDLKRNAKKTVLAWERGGLFVDPNKVRGANGEMSWAGSGRKSYIRGGQAIEGNSSDAIRHYASLESKIPGYSAFALDLILTDNEPVLYASHDFHRTAAARLRGGEPLEFSSIVIYDARNAIGQ